MCTRQAVPAPNQGSVPTLWRPLLAAWVVAQGSRQGDAVLTEVVRVAEVEDVTAVHMMVQGLLDQVLRLVPSQLGHPGRGWQVP